MTEIQFPFTSSPFQQIPTLLLQPKLLSINNNNNNNNNSNNGYAENNNKIEEHVIKKPLKIRDLERKTGVAILKFVYSKKGSIVKSNNTANAHDLKNKQQQHKPTFYIPDNDNRDTKTPTVTSLMADKMGFITDENLKAINKKFLMEHNVTIYNLIVDCEVSIIELHLAGIISNFQDLLDLKFLLTDLTIGKKKLFNADKLVTFFDVTYESLKEREDFSFTIFDIIEGDFYANELETLGFTFDYVMKRKYLTRQQLREFKIGLEGLKLLGFKKEYMDPLRISENFALTKLKWTLSEYTEFMS